MALAMRKGFEARGYGEKLSSQKISRRCWQQRFEDPIAAEEGFVMSITTLHEKDAKNQGIHDELEILALIDGMHTAHHDKNAAAIAALYDRQAAVFNLAPPLTHVGVDLEEKQRWLDSWATPVEIESRDLKVTISGDFAFVHGFLRLRGTKKGPEGSVDFWMRETLCLERQAGAWRIVHEHTSVPFYMDGSLRPAFDLRP
jgi:ketosteroid isomerase-like protein